MNKDEMEEGKTYFDDGRRYAACGNCGGGAERIIPTGDADTDFQHARCPVFEILVLPKAHQYWEKANGDIDKAIILAKRKMDESNTYEDGGVYHLLKTIKEQGETLDYDKYKEISVDSKVLFMLLCMRKLTEEALND